MAQSLEVGRYCLLCSLVPDVTSMSIQAYMEGVLHIVFLAPPTFDEVDDITHLAGGYCSYMSYYASQ